MLFGLGLNFEVLEGLFELVGLLMVQLGKLLALMELLGLMWVYLYRNKPV